MRCLLSVAVLAAAAPAALAFDDGALIQSAAFASEGALSGAAGGLNGGAILEVDGQFADVKQYGEPVMLTVHPVFGDDLPIMFRPGMRLHTLMKSVCHKLDLNLASVNFTKNGMPLDPESKGTAVGLSEGDVIEVTAPGLLHKAAANQDHIARKEKQARMLLQEQERRDTMEAVRNTKRRKAAERAAKRAEYDQRKHKLDLNGEITLQFTSPTGGDDVSMAVKRVNWLDGYFKLVAKRFGVDRTQTLFLFRDDEGNMHEIEPHDSVQTLGLEDDERIEVKLRPEH